MPSSKARERVTVWEDQWSRIKHFKKHFGSSWWRLQVECSNGMWDKRHHDIITLPVKDSNNMTTSFTLMRFGVWMKQSWKIKLKKGLNFLVHLMEIKFFDTSEMMDHGAQEEECCGDMAALWHFVSFMGTSHNQYLDYKIPWVVQLSMLDHQLAIRLLEHYIRACQTDTWL